MEMREGAGAGCERGGEEMVGEGAEGESVDGSSSVDEEGVETPSGPSG